MSNEKESRKQFFDILGMTCAIITVIAYLVLVINAQWQFLGEVDWLYNILVIIQTYAPLVVVALVGLEFVANKSFLVRIIYYVAVALIVISMFFPSTWQYLVGLVGLE